MAETGGKEETPLLVALAMSAELQAVEAELRDAAPRASARPLPSRSGAGGALDRGADRARAGVARRGAEGGRSRSCSGSRRRSRRGRCSAGAPASSRSGATLYGCELTAGIPRSDDLAARLATGADVDAVVGDLAAALGAEEELARRAEGAVAVARLRELLAAPSSPRRRRGRWTRSAASRSCSSAPGSLGGGPGRGRRAEGAGGRAGGERGSAARRARRWSRRSALAQGLEGAGAGCAVTGCGATRRGPSTRLRPRRSSAMSRSSGSSPPPERRSLSGPARRRRVGPTWSGRPGGSTGSRRSPGPIRRTSVERNVGHLFADIKDFTRRTSLLGQASMAELLRREFYVPILVAGEGALRRRRATSPTAAA